MNKKSFITILILFVSLMSFGQRTTNSPYSYYGIGELNFAGNAEERFMGRLGVHADSIRLNMQNPASLAKLQYTAFTAGFSLKSNQITSKSGTEKTQSSAVDYVALGFPIYKNLGLSFGLLPYSSVGYKFSSLSTGNSPKKYNRFEGSGGVNQLFTSLGYTLYKGLSVGASAKIFFGNTQMTTYELKENVELFTSENNQSTLRGAALSLGLYYEKPVTKHLEVNASLVYTPQTKLNSNNTRSISTGNFASNGSVVIRDNINIDLNALNLSSTKITLPSQLELGLGLGQKRKWFAGIEYTHISSEKFSNPLITSNKVTYENGYQVAIGGFFIPQYNSFSSYWKRVVYRAGVHYEKTGILLNNESITDFGISFGASLPVKGFSNATIGFETGKRGTLSQNLVKENYFNLRIGFTLNDKWFQKTKYQ